MRICAYINFKGRSREALEFYGKAFGTQPQFHTYAEMPPDPDWPVTEDMKPLIMHGELNIAENQAIMCADDLRPGEGVMGNAMSLTLMLDDEAELRRIFAALAEGGEIVMPLARTFWSVCFGSLKERFGVIWSLNLCRMPEA